MNKQDCPVCNSTGLVFSLFAGWKVCPLLLKYNGLYKKLTPEEIPGIITWFRELINRKNQGTA